MSQSQDYLESEEGDNIKIPMTIYTFDITDPVTNFLEPQYDEVEDNELHRKVDGGYKNVAKVQRPIKWGSADIIRQIDEARRSIPTAFYQKYNLGIQQYLDGEWQNARELLQEASKIYQGDGPTRQLLLYMKSKNYEAPKNWKETYHEMSDF